ncbi:MAG TPA: 50S ribosomal protein L5 [Candidatus Paceibacterota bacterium]
MKSHYTQFEKAVVNIGVGRLSSQPNFEDKVLPEIQKELSTITGQKPSPRLAAKSIAGFKLRAGTVVGLKVTLRGERMVSFLNRLVRITLPRVRDFRGIDLKSVDKNGNLTIGIKEQVVFPEIVPETSRVNFGMEITVVPKVVKSREQVIATYRAIGIPFKKEGSNK